MTLVVDANLMVALVVPVAYSEAASEKLGEWIAAGEDLVAPALWSYEAISAVRKFIAHGHLSEAEAKAAVSRLMELKPLEILASADLHQSALSWAQRLGHSVAYDAAYLALAESLEAEFWTADRKLVRKARSVGCPWIRALTSDEKNFESSR